jgi:hypothetical protein
MRGGMVEVAVVPAAGRGLRMRPLTASVPKEMLPFGRWPLIEHTVAELAASGVSEICGKSSGIIWAGGRDVTPRQGSPSLTRKRPPTWGAPFGAPTTSSEAAGF